MKMRLRNGKWYAAFKWKGRFIGRSLDAKEHEIRLAERNLVRLVEDLERRDKENNSSVVGKKFSDLIPAYQEHVLSGKPEKYRVRAVSILRYLREHFGDIPVSRIDKDIVVAYKRKRELKGAKGATIRKELYCLKMVMNLEDEYWRLPSFRRPDMQFFNKGRKITRRLTKEEADRIVQCADSWLQPIIITGLYTGLRLGNVLELQWSQIDFDRRFIWVQDTKNGEDVQVPLVSILYETLVYLRRVRTPGRDFVFPRNSALIQFMRRVQKACARAHEAAGVGWLRPFHDYRHFFCHYLVNEGKADYVVVAKLAGHKNPSMTLRYSEPGLEIKRAAMQVFEKTGDSGFLATPALDNTGSGANLACKPLPKPLESRLPIHDKLFGNN